MQLGQHLSHWQQGMYMTPDILLAKAWKSSSASEPHRQMAGYKTLPVARHDYNIQNLKKCVATQIRDVLNNSSFFAFVPTTMDRMIFYCTTAPKEHALLERVPIDNSESCRLKLQCYSEML